MRKFLEYLALAEFIEMYHDALVADFQRDYNLNLDLIIEEGIGPAHLKALVMGIGPNSALQRAANPDTWMWDTKTELLAIIAELIDRHDRNYEVVNTENHRGHDPIKIPRPGKEPQKKGTSLGELKEILRGYKKEQKRDK